jgi:LCP family protein required for cell wall assembly
MKPYGTPAQKTLTVLFIFVIFLPACTFPLARPVSPTPIPIADMLINADSTYPPTPTPFQPVYPTIPVDGNSDPVTINDPPQVSTQEPTATPRPRIIKPIGQVNILLMGSDWRSGSGFRTDVLLLVSLNKNTGTATLVSFPRDLYVEIPGVGMQRINAAQEYGGFTLTAATFMNNFGVDIDYYMLTNFGGFISIVDTLGGINVFASNALSDLCALPQAVDDYCYIPYGNNFMDGQTALWYVRSRHSTSDFDRTRRAQEVLIAIFQKAMSLNALSRGPELYELFRNSVDTDIPVGTVLDLLPMGSRILSDTSMIRRFAIGTGQVYNYVVPATGAMVLIPDDTLVNQILREALEQ